jgi:ectoine hydroxylase-related dioxygenase (phytanoyl-CoA dioxygenase family)
MAPVSPILNHTQETRKTPVTATLIQSAQPFSKEETARIVEQFERDGYIHLGNLLTTEEVQGLRERIDCVFDDPTSEQTHHNLAGWMLIRIFERDNMFRDMLVREPIISLMEAMLGPDCHLINDGVVRNDPGQALSQWHVDDTVYFPISPGMQRHDPRLKMPIFAINVQIALSDVPSDEYGPTQVVPGSHYSGRYPEQQNPTFEGQGPVSIYTRAGDVYLQNSQVWHRGAPNTSNRRRYLYQLAYSPRFMSQRFYPYLNYRMPDHVLEGADERLLRVLGKHSIGAWG